MMWTSLRLRLVKSHTLATAFMLLPSMCATNMEGRDSENKEHSRIRTETFVPREGPFWEELARSTGNTIQGGLDTGIPANLSYSFVCGFCSGYALKKVGRAAAFVFGMGFITLQTLSYHGYIQVDHSRLRKDLESSLLLGQDRAKDRSVAINKAFHILQHQFPAGVGFGTGFVGGIRSG